MDAKQIVEESAAEKWQAYCLAHPQRFRGLGGTSAARKRVERWEAAMIEQLQDLALEVKSRADAFRAVMELRGCSGRDVATYFNLTPDVVILGLSLLEMPVSPDAVPPAAVAVDAVAVDAARAA